MDNKYLNTISSWYHGIVQWIVSWYQRTKVKFGSWTLYGLIVGMLLVLICSITLGVRSCSGSGMYDFRTSSQAVDFYREAKSAGIKPIIGCEVYVARRTRFDREMKLDSHPYHLILLCKNNQGYKNLIKLVSLGYTEGFYSKPRVDVELLEKYSVRDYTDAEIYDILDSNNLSNNFMRSPS